MNKSINSVSFFSLYHEYRGKRIMRRKEKTEKENQYPCPLQDSPAAKQISTISERNTSRIFHFSRSFGLDADTKQVECCWTNFDSNFLPSFATGPLGGQIANYGDPRATYRRRRRRINMSGNDVATLISPQDCSGALGVISGPTSLLCFFFFVVPEDKKEELKLSHFADKWLRQTRPEQNKSASPDGSGG